MSNREVFYEVHVKAFSKLNKNIPTKGRGTYLGLCSPWAIAHYKSLGVTVLQVMPVLKNNPSAKGSFWGYGPVSMFELNPSYGTELELIQMINTLNKHDIKVIFDVVFNHTDGYLPELEYDHTDRYGCGYPVAVNSPKSLKVIKQAIYRLLSEIGADGLRFDLGGCLLRELDGSLNPNSEILTWLEKEYSDTKIFSAECYDLHGNYRDMFPSWILRISNSIRDQVRDQQQYIHTKDGIPERNVGLVTVHDGNTLMDNCTFQGKYNFINGENNQDGNNDSKADNCSIEGFTDNSQVLCWRQARADSMLNSLQNYTGNVLLHQGDVETNEHGRWVARMTNTQFGCNNAYCQDNLVGWVIWDKLSFKQLKLLQSKMNP